MPITAKLSRRFYEKFGDDVVNELVELLNQVDSASRSELRQLNEANFARLEGKLEASYARLENKFEARIAELKAELIKWMFLFWAGTSLAGLLMR